ncbi:MULTISPECIES: acyl-CoA dehydrogenase family protein [unclassified Streptomyces]|uniref:acyl-CoA dehydrogenase family protein n=1 Tax=unclassified Streptomyces TaxID=2593676 RepID=UPI00278BF52A|nr:MULTISPECIES: acyl-CoA dehydrogenase family protein [unclassified Streptomyces]
MNAPPLPVRAREAAATAATHRRHADETRNLHPDVARALVAAGFARHFVPERRGGCAGSHRDTVEGVIAVGTECASAAWCAAIFAYGGRMAGRLPERGQDELWSAGPDAVTVAALQPTGRTGAVPGGWRITGRWSYVSGAAHADWALVQAPVDADGGGEPRRRFFAVPRAEFDVEDTWHTLGMRGTGSNTVAVDDVLVPAHRTFGAEELDHAPVPLRTTAGLTFAPPLVGAARAALAVCARELPPSVDLVRAAGDTELARDVLLRVASAADRHADTERRDWQTWAPWDCARAAELVKAAADRLMEAAGTRAYAEGHPVQRAWRDIRTGASHVRLRPELAAAPCLVALKELHDEH